MNTKQALIDKIKRIEDPELLEELDKWVSSLIEITAMETYSKEEISAVREGYKQYLAGDTVSQAEANRLFDEWLNEI